MTQHLRSVGIILVLIMGSIGAFNFFVDPLLLFHHKGAGSDTLSRIEQFHNMRLYKPLHVNEKKPDAIIIGTSRSGTIRTRHPAWQGLEAYNLSMPGMTIYELSRSVQHAQANQPLQKLMIGLDYSAIISPEPLYRSGFEPARMAQVGASRHAITLIGQRLRDLQTVLFSYEILGESALAVTQTNPGIRQYHLDGSWEALSNRLTGRGGYIYVARNTVQARSKTTLDNRPNLATLRHLLDFCYRNNIETRLFFTPVHSFMLDLWFRMSPETLWRDTHRQIIEMNADLAARYNREPFAIWGFANEEQAVSEPIYLTRQIDQAWFNDGVHFRAKMAEAVMDALWGPSAAFGRRLTTSTVDEYLDTVDSLRQAFIDSHKPLVDQLHGKIGGQFENLQPDSATPAEIPPTALR